MQAVVCNTIGEIYCKQCGEYKEKTDFEVNPETNLPFSKCIRCFQKNAEERRRKINDRQRIDQYKYQYGITIEEYNEMFVKQEGKCAVCGTHQKDLKGRLAVDHCHETDVVRGLLCTSCNLGLGIFKDDIKRLREAISYLNKFKHNGNN